MLNSDFYIPLMEFLGLYLGQDFELILCDTEKVLQVENPFDSSQVPGAPLGEMQQSFIENPDCQDIPYTINYRALTSSKEKLRSATLFIREKNKLVGLLTINSKVSKLIEVREILDTLINGESGHNTSTVKEKTNKKKPTEYYETLSISVNEIIDSVISDACRTFGANPERFTSDEKFQIIQEMDSKGVFLVKGSVAEVARQLKTSDTTIYRYLHQINK